MRRVALALVALAACGRIDFTSVAPVDAQVADSRLADPTLRVHFTMDDVPGDGDLVASDGTLAQCEATRCGAAASGRLGAGVRFDGSRFYRIAEAAPNLVPASGFTVAIWVNPRVGGFQMFATRRFQAIYNAWGLQLDATGVAQLETAHELAGGGTSPDFLPGTTVLPLSTWTHVAATYDGAVRRLYVNGVLENTDVQPAVDIDTNETLIGADEDLGGAGLFGFSDAVLDELRVYDRALSPAEIAALSAE